ncbi:uncharacterized protein LOC111321886 [Stylophora pistillata]|uniref:FHA domain-containing protein n=1 Tax=Stylophora pistillata TaxID=50429 RepID=A0A2B4SLR0_STYPI|nr:uncharacterized protein LOC111321886 [Stylophora pistillata]PFX31624.1 hypothetical protein AWC38_SpisGene3564 [Stylophora pistillata]
MSEVDRDAATKEDEDIINSTVDREGITVDAEFSNHDLIEREKETVSSPPRIIFCVTEIATNNTSLLKGIPKEPILQSSDQHVLFGRGHSAGVFLNDDIASREHMKLSLQTNPYTGESNFCVETVSETKPVIINGTPLFKQDGIKFLKTNDKLGIGKLVFILQIVPGDSLEFYEVEFMTSTSLPHQYYKQQTNNPMPYAPPMGAFNSRPNIMANQIGAVFLQNNLGTPVGNPTLNMNVMTDGGGFPQFGTMVSPQQQQPFQQQPIGYSLIPNKIGMSQHPLQQQAANINFHYQLPDSTYPTTQSFLLPHQIPSPSGRQVHQNSNKHPTEHSDKFKENGHSSTSLVPIQETIHSKDYVK